MIIAWINHNISLEEFSLSHLYLGDYVASLEINNFPIVHNILL